MDDSPNSIGADENVGEPLGDVEPSGTVPSPYAPRPLGGHEPGATTAPESNLPPAKDLDRLRLAASNMAESGISLEQSALHHGVDPDTLHVYYRTYVNFVGRDQVGDGARERTEIDEAAHRHFDMNWAEMLYEAERDRPQLSPMRKRLITSPLTGWMFNGDSVDKMAVSGAACVIGFGVLAVTLTFSHRGKAAAQEADVPAKLDAAGGGGKPWAEVDDELQQELLERLASVLNEFIQLETWQERLPFIRDRERVTPLMEGYYEDHPDGPIRSLVIDSELSLIQRGESRFALIQGVSKPEGEAGKPLTFLIEMSAGDSEFLIDWEVLVNYEPVPWETFKSEMVVDAAPFRVRVMAGDYYNFPFMDELEYKSYQLKLFGRDEAVFGFVRKGSELATAIDGSLFRELSEQRAMILNLRYPEDGKLDNIVEIESIVSENW